MVGKKAEREAMQTRIRGKATQRLRAHLEMLSTVQPDVDKALVDLEQEISAMTAEANHTLKKLEETISSSGETPKKGMQRRIRMLAEKQALVAEAANQGPLSYIRAYCRYLKTIIKLSKAEG